MSQPQLKTLPAYVEAALPVPLRRTFTYRIPAALRGRIKPGARLKVPFGKRDLTGYAVTLHDDLPPDVEIDESKIKDVVDLLDDEPLITPEILDLTQWTADYYASFWGEMLKAALPAGIHSETVRPKRRKAVRLLRNADTHVRNEGEARTTAATFANKKGWHQRGYLPHFDGVTTQFVTFHLSDSLPQAILRRLKDQLQEDRLPDASRKLRKQIEEFLDRGIGECILRRPRVAAIVRETILNEHGRSCHLMRWVIMPNHVHILLAPLEGHSLSQIMKRIKGISARKINQLLGRSGAVWHPDYFDRFIRDEKHFARTIHYIDQNPVKAGLCESPELWPFNGLSPQAAIADKSVRVPLTDQQRLILDLLESNGGEMLFTDLTGRADVGASPINTLAKRGFVEVYIQDVRRDPLGEAKIADAQPFVLTPEQQTAFDAIATALKTGGYKAFLLHGVTGSGKTEVYIRAIQRALELGRSALMLVPEIALTPLFSRRLRAVFGSEVAILHSNLGAGERYDEWRRIRNSEARVAIGTRSAVFAPLQDLGLVIVDEEHDPSYRQHESPFYNARDVAVMRANQAGAVAALGSATPAMESFYNARNGKYEYLRLPERYGGRSLAEAGLIDMREVFKQAGGKDVALSPELLAAIKETHERGEQVIILLNRRGFSQFVLCRTCGETIKCKNCDITLTFHRATNQLVCHYCSYREPSPRVCPLCTSEYLYFVGQGTENIEDQLRKKFPEMRIARIDRDTMSHKGELDRVLLDFDAGRIDMLVGTQMIAKGHDFPRVTLVGVVSVDIGLGLPDLRSAERTFQLITQVAGRSGRGEKAGRVLIQTYYPEHYALRHAVKQNYEGFYAEEIKYRERLAYPPFFVLASIMIKHRDRNHAAKTANILRRALDTANAARHLRVLGPAPASLSRLKNEYRIQIILKGQTRRALRDTLDIALANAESQGADVRSIYVEIDPVNLM